MASSNKYFVKTQPITVTLPIQLVAWIDQLARQEFATRSDIIRQAALAYVRNSDLDTTNASQLFREIDAKPLPKSAELERDYEKIAENLKAKHPHAALYDKTLLVFLDDYEQGKP